MPRNPDVAYAEAVTALRHRLEGWGVPADEAHDKAHGFIRDLIAQGWRPRAPRVEDVPAGSGRRCPTEDAPPEYRAARAQLRTRRPVDAPEETTTAEGPVAGEDTTAEGRPCVETTA
jgi:hypothetical protein